MTSDPSPVGLRPDDLDPAERDALQALLQSDPEARADHQFAQALTSAFDDDGSEDSGDAPSAADILAMARERTEAPPAAVPPAAAPPAADTPGSRVGGWAIAAAVVVAIGVVSTGLWTAGPDPAGSEATEPDLRPRGDALPDAEVHLEAVADGPGLRSLGDGDAVHDAEAVVFHVTTTRPGRVTLSEHGPGEARPILEWTAQTGRHPLAADDGSPLAWTPESAGVRRYIVQWCPEDGAIPCETDALELRWEGPR